MISESRLLKYWRDEQTFPRWFRDGNSVWKITEADFLEFCHNCWRIYEIDGCALLYVERQGRNAEIHFSVLRGHKIDPESLIPIRLELLTEFDCVYGWVAAKNRGIKAVCNLLGMRFQGLRMFKGKSHGKVLEWQQVSINRSELYCSSILYEPLINLA